jgi:diguanylate cyclase (GGDEF)-like protein
MLDIDFFKLVNDNYGHQIGDRVLIEVSNQIIKNVRNSDLVGRYGGEEFIVILPDIKSEDAYKLAERIRLSIQEYDFGVSGLKVTISIGLAQRNTEDGKAIINRADNLLYQAKMKGRNRIENIEESN